MLRLVTSVDLPVARDLLVASKLPTDIVDERKGSLWIVEDGESRAVGGFEFYGEDALLRSVAVDEKHRKSGIGSRLVDALLVEASSRGVKRVWLLTETAEAFFSKKGFRKVQRSEITNTALLASAEFTHLCSVVAVCMVKQSI